jgi:thermitase
MRSSRRFSVFTQLALLSAALMSCGAPVTGTPSQTSTETPVAVSAPKAQLQVSGNIVTLSVKPATTEADLLSRYPGARVLALHPADGYAVVWATEDILNQRLLGTLSVSAQSVAVTSSEPDQTVLSSESETDDAEAQGNSVWAGGNSVWAGGYTAFTASSGANNTFNENVNVWNNLDLSGGQRQAPGLGRGITVAVLDTGIDFYHIGLAGHINEAAAWDFVDNDSFAFDNNWSPDGASFFGHGTGVAGLILQVAPNATILPLRVLSPSGVGKLSNVIQAMYMASAKGAKVINMSLGSKTGSLALQNAVSNAIRGGAMVVTSSGNSGDHNVTFPARYSPTFQTTLGGGLISVGSVNSRSLKSHFSTYGPSIDIMAPGEGMATEFPWAQRTNATGTSFAAPVVSGAVALAMSTGRTDVIALYKSLKASANAPVDAQYGSEMGRGTLNVGRLLSSK